MGLIAVADDEVACIVTTLEMRQRPRPAPLPEAPLRLVEWPAASPDTYRTLFRRVGAPWLWYSRLAIDDAALSAIIHDPAVGVHVVLDRAGIEIGLLELDHRTPGLCVIAYLALVPELAGRGLGRWLMAQALIRAWCADTDVVRVNTCTLDHPRALGFYRAQGFAAVSRTIETFADPRAIGLLPADAAPQIPYLSRNAPTPSTSTPAR